MREKLLWESWGVIHSMASMVPGRHTSSLVSYLLSECTLSIFCRRKDFPTTHVSCLVLVSLWGRCVQQGSGIDPMTQDLGTKGDGLVNGNGVPGVGDMDQSAGSTVPSVFGMC